MQKRNRIHDQGIDFQNSKENHPSGFQTIPL